MDLHVIGPLASPAERAAVDSVLGEARSGRKLVLTEEDMGGPAAPAEAPPEQAPA